MWLRLDDKLHSDARVVEAGLEAFGLLVLLLLWNNDQLADGFVPAAIVRQKGGASADALVDGLVGVSLVERGERDGRPGVELAADIVRLQPTREQAERERALARERKERHRKKNAPVTGVSQRDRSVQGTPTSQDPGPTRPDPASPRAKTARGPRTRDAHAGCDPEARAACLKGWCIPTGLVEREIRPQVTEAGYTTAECVSWIVEGMQAAPADAWAHWRKEVSHFVTAVRRRDQRAVS